MPMHPIKGLDDIMQGAVTERFAAALQSTLKNVCDVNTDAKRKRKITLTLTIAPNGQRTAADFTMDVKTALAPPVPVSTTVSIDRDDEGRVSATELQGQVPGQLDMDGQAAPQPGVLEFTARK